MTLNILLIVLVATTIGYLIYNGIKALKVLYKSHSYFRMWLAIFFYLALIACFVWYLLYLGFNISIGFH